VAATVTGLGASEGVGSEGTVAIGQDQEGKRGLVEGVGGGGCWGVCVPLGWRVASAPDGGMGTFGAAGGTRRGGGGQNRQHCGGSPARWAGAVGVGGRRAGGGGFNIAGGGRENGGRGGRGAGGGEGGGGRGGPGARGWTVAGEGCDGPCWVVEVDLV